MNKLPNDLINYTFEYLNVVDIIGLSRSSQFHHNINIAKIFKDRLINVISQTCRITPSLSIKLIEKIKQHRGIISGSAILQVLYGTIYDNSDLDIYFRNHEKDPAIIQCNRNDMISIINPDCASRSAYNVIPPELYINEEKEVLITECMAPSQSLKSDFNLIYNYKSARIPTIYNNIQIIEVSTQKFLPDFQSFTDTFDLSIVCNVYNPCEKSLEVYNYNYLFRKYSAVITPPTHTRLEKYRDRGFTISYEPYYKQFVDFGKLNSSILEYFSNNIK